MHSGIEVLSPFEGDRKIEKSSGEAKEEDEGTREKVLRQDVEGGRGRR